jgi:hypothetical protein
MISMMEQFPDTIIWGTDSPASSYICRRKKREGEFFEFRCKGNYEDEKDALDALCPEMKKKACNENSIKFLFG